MVPRLGLDEENQENDVRYSIADCRKRLRSQRATLRAQHQTPIDVSNGESEVPARSVRLRRRTGDCSFEVDPGLMVGPKSRASRGEQNHEGKS
jgi:hypothetical protein